jgi:hypothetical protein
VKSFFALSLFSLLLLPIADTLASEDVRTPLDIDHTASIVGIQIGKRIAAFIFISTDGKHLNVGADECAQSDKCQAIMAKLGSDGRTDLLQFEPSHEADSPPAIDDAPAQSSPRVLTDANVLPHRALHEIDLQGHQAGTARDLCPGQIRENVPESGVLLYCWGIKP